MLREPGPHGCFGCAGEGNLLQFRQPVDDAKSDVTAELDLHHLGGEVLADVFHVLSGDLQLPSASFHQVVDKERRQVLNFIVAGMVAEIDDLWHGDSYKPLVSTTYRRGTAVSTMPQT